MHNFESKILALGKNSGIYWGEMLCYLHVNRDHNTKTKEVTGYCYVRVLTGSRSEKRERYETDKTLSGFTNHSE